MASCSLAFDWTPTNRSTTSTLAEQHHNVGMFITPPEFCAAPGLFVDVQLADLDRRRHSLAASSSTTGPINRHGPHQVRPKIDQHWGGRLEHFLAKVSSVNSLSWPAMFDYLPRTALN